MALLPTRGGLVRRLRKKMWLLVPEDPGRERMLELVRLLDPDAKSWGRRQIRVDLGGQIFLHGPVRVDPEVAREAQVPDGLPAAFFTHLDTAPGRPILSDERMKDQRFGERKTWQDSVSLLAGLAVRLGGAAMPRPAAIREPLQVSVYLLNRVTPEEVAGLLGRYVPGLARVPDGPFALSVHMTKWRAERAGLVVEYWPPETSNMATVSPDSPAALGKLQYKSREWSVTSLQLAQPAESVDPEVARWLGEMALGLAAAADGICVDPLGFRVLRPGELVIR